MTFGYLLRLFGLNAVVGGIMVTLTQPWIFLDPESFIATYFDHIGFVLILIGVIGLYFVQYKSTGILGFISFLFLLLSLSLWLGYKWFQSFVLTDIQKSPEFIEAGLHTTVYGMDLSYSTFIIGIFIFAVISLWKGKLSRWGLSLLLLGTIADFAGRTTSLLNYNTFITQMIIGIAFSLLGVTLLQGRYDDVDTSEQIETKKETLLLTTLLDHDTTNENEPIISANTNSHDQEYAPKIAYLDSEAGTSILHEGQIELKHDHT